MQNLKVFRKGGEEHVGQDPRYEEAHKVGSLTRHAGILSYEEEGGLGEEQDDGDGDAQGGEDADAAEGPLAVCDEVVGAVCLREERVQRHRNPGERIDDSAVVCSPEGGCRKFVAPEVACKGTGHWIRAGPAIDLNDSSSPTKARSTTFIRNDKKDVALIGAASESRAEISLAYSGGIN